MGKACPVSILKFSTLQKQIHDIRNSEMVLNRPLLHAPTNPNCIQEFSEGHFETDQIATLAFIV
jgi:hypothetical protein